MPRKFVMAVAVAATAAVLLWAALSGAPGRVEIEVASAVTPLPLRPASSAATAAAVAAAVPSPRAEDSHATRPSDDEMAAHLRDKFGTAIHHRHTQIKVLEKLIAYLQKLYPEDWRDRVHDLLKQAFPELADALFAQFGKLLRYNDWMRDNRHELMQMEGRDRREALWDARREHFGDDAEEIWEVTRKNERIVESLEAIDAAGGGIGEKLERYVDAIHEAYGEQAEPFLDRRRTELTLRFLSGDTVQEDLHGMSPAERRQALGEIRRGMGLDEAAVARLAALDDERDREWAVGDDYLRRRAEIAAQYQGDEQARRLERLRTELFGDQAEVIASEESAGFLRFDHRRRLGRE